MKITSKTEVAILLLGICFIFSNILTYLFVFIYIFNHPTRQVLFLIITLMSMKLRTMGLAKVAGPLAQSQHKYFCSWSASSLLLSVVLQGPLEIFSHV